MSFLEWPNQLQYPIPCHERLLELGSEANIVNANAAIHMANFA